MNENFRVGFTLTFYSFNDHRLVVIDHVKELFSLLSFKIENVVPVKLINHKDLTKIADNTRVCNNHVFLGRPYGQHPHPTLFTRGYSRRESNSENMDIQHIIKAGLSIRGTMRITFKQEKVD